ncbi:hypothetical protein TeGR_g12579, partial [Tetraparma gracilis]
YSELWQEELDIEMTKQGEMDCLVAGLEFVLASRVGECYTFKPPKDAPAPSLPSPKADVSVEWSRKVQRDTIQDDTSYPYIVVSIGTGVSFIRVDGPGGNFQRVSGSTIGGGTYWGLCRLLTDVEKFEEVLALAEKGDSEKVDMLVKDIYGTNKDALDKLKLPGRIVASSFGKLVSKETPAEGLEQEDLARALLMMTTNNIAHLSYLTAQLYKTSRIYFVGNFLRHNTISCQRLSYSISFWSDNKVEALFLEHEGFLGALGAFLLSQDGQPGADVKANASGASKDVAASGAPNGFRRRSQSLSVGAKRLFVRGELARVEEEGEEEALEEEEEAEDPDWWIRMDGEKRTDFMISELGCDARVTNKLFGKGGDSGIERRRLMMCMGFVVVFVALEEAKKEAGRRALERWCVVRRKKGRGGAAGGAGQKSAGEGPSANPFAGLECEDTAVVATVGEEEAGKRLGTPEEVLEKQGGEQEAVLGVMACVLLRWRELLMRMAVPSAAAVFFVFLATSVVAAMSG